MSILQRQLLQAIFARIAFGAVPVDGHVWVDPNLRNTEPEPRPDVSNTHASPAARCLRGVAT